MTFATGYLAEVYDVGSLKYYSLSYTKNACYALLAHSATTWTAIQDSSTFRTTDAGVTWAAAAADIGDMTGVSKVCTADKTKAISCDHDSGNVSYSTDSGNNWTSATTDPALITRVFDLSFITTGVAVVACDIGTAARSIFYSTDGGNNWTICATGPAVDTVAIDMFDATNGIAVDVSGNVWTSSDGGINWSDTTYAVVGAASQSSIKCLTSSTYVFIQASNDMVQTGTTSTDGVTRIQQVFGGNFPAYTSNLIKASNGNLYFVLYSFRDKAEINDLISNITLYKSSDSGVTWAVSTIPILDMMYRTTMFTNEDAKSQLVEYDTNKFLLKAGTYLILKIDESWDA